MRMMITKEKEINTKIRLSNYKKNSQVSQPFLILKKVIVLELRSKSLTKIRDTSKKEWKDSRKINLKLKASQ
jgi:hypothetical protein